MRIKVSKAARALLLVPVTLGLQAQRAPEDCSARAETGVHIEPILLLATEPGLRTQVVNGNVIAEEVMQVATEGWRLRNALGLADEGLEFPAGTPLEAAYRSRERRCLPHAPGARDTESARAPRRMPGRGRLACLVDADGDGRFEQVRMYGTDYAMHVPQERLYRTIALPSPAVLEPDPFGDRLSRRRFTRRLSIGTVQGDRVRFIVSHRVDNRIDNRDEGVWDEAPGGGHVYRLQPQLPIPLQYAGQDPSANSLSGEMVRLVEGETIEVGGLRLMVEGDSPSFPGMLSLRASAPRFPRWIHFGCGGRSLRVGTDAE